MIKIQTISSGSQGNITYIGGDKTNILVDIGLPLSHVLSRLQSANIAPESIDAVLITHEHNDHIAGVADFVQKYGTKIYCHKKTKRILKKHICTDDDVFIEFEDVFNIGEISVRFFPVPHDSEFCFGYTFTADNTAVGLATDIGRITNTILSHLSACQIVVLECNHDHAMLLANTKYPVWLKRRILGSRGHLSNAECGAAIAELYRHNVGQIILAHLSKENNSPTLAYTVVKEFLHTKNICEGKDIFIDIADQDKIGNLYQID
jgi:phosphoribosyl 1,2-cyclic phosphodiesterase